MAHQNCPQCGAAGASGNFCSTCGRPLTGGSCGACGAGLTPGARFCHRCGEPAAGLVPRRTEQRAWLLAGGIGVVLVGLVIYLMVRGTRPAPPPDMANPGSSAGLGGPAPDISQMSPEEQFERLFNRVTRLAQAGDSAQVLAFTPMALGAYDRLPARTDDDRFHAAMLHFLVGDFAGSLALADTIEQSVPQHLFAPLIRGSVAQVQENTAGLLAQYRVFLERYPAESAAGRIEYEEHDQIIEQFRQSADSAVRSSPR